MKVSSAQSMSVTIQALRSARVTWRWFVTAFRRELVTAVLLGLACGTLVAMIVWLWRKDALAAGVIGGSIAFRSSQPACSGSGVPSVLHRFKLDPKIAAGPITLAAGRFLCARLLFQQRLARLRMNIAVVIPALNEEEPIGDVVRAVAATNIPSEIIVVDNGSTRSNG